MGNGPSTFEPANFDTEEIRRLGKRWGHTLTSAILMTMMVSSSSRFRKLDSDKSGNVSLEEFLSLPELKKNPLVQRVIGDCCQELTLIYTSEYLSCAFGSLERCFSLT